MAYDPKKDEVVFDAGTVRLEDNRIRVTVRVNHNVSDHTPKIVYEEIRKGKQRGRFLRRLSLAQDDAVEEARMAAKRFMEESAAPAPAAATGTDG